MLFFTTGVAETFKKHPDLGFLTKQQREQVWQELFDADPHYTTQQQD